MPPVPRPLLLAALAVALQGVGLVVAGAAEAVATVVGEPESVTGSLVTAALAVAVGAGVLLGARALRDARRRARGPLLALEIIFVPTGFQLLGALAPAGIALLVTAVVGVYGLLHPRTSDALAEP